MKEAPHNIKTLEAISALFVHVYRDRAEMKGNAFTNSGSG